MAWEAPTGSPQGGKAGQDLLGYSRVGGMALFSSHRGRKAQSEGLRIHLSPVPQAQHSWASVRKAKSRAVFLLLSRAGPTPWPAGLCNLLEGSLSPYPLLSYWVIGLSLSYLPRG